MVKGGVGPYIFSLHSLASHHHSLTRTLGKCVHLVCIYNQRLYLTKIIVQVASQSSAHVLSQFADSVLFEFVEINKMN